MAIPAVCTACTGGAIVSTHVIGSTHGQTRKRECRRMSKADADRGGNREHCRWVDMTECVASLPATVTLAAPRDRASTNGTRAPSGKGGAVGKRGTWRDFQPPSGTYTKGTALSGRCSDHSGQLADERDERSNSFTDCFSHHHSPKQTHLPALLWLAKGCIGHRLVRVAQTVTLLEDLEDTANLLRELTCASPAVKVRGFIKLAVMG